MPLQRVTPVNEGDTRLLPRSHPHQRACVSATAWFWSRPSNQSCERRQSTAAQHPKRRAGAGSYRTEDHGRRSNKQCEHACHRTHIRWHLSPGHPPHCKCVPAHAWQVKGNTRPRPTQGPECCGPTGLHLTAIHFKDSAECSAQQGDNQGLMIHWEAFSTGNAHSYSGNDVDTRYHNQSSGLHYL